MERAFLVIAIACALCLVWLEVKDALAQQERKRRRHRPTVPANRWPPHSEP